MTEELLVKELEKLKDHLELNNDLMLIFYNPSIEEPMELCDFNSIFAYIKQLQVKRMTVMLYGSGGNLKAGGAIGQLLQEHFDYYETFVPFSCCSSMCYPFLYSRKLSLLSTFNITQIDPIAKIETESIRIIRALGIKDPLISSQARQHLNDIRDLIPKVLANKKSLYNHKQGTLLTANEEIDNLVDLFMNKDEHASKISYEELKQLNLNVKMIAENPQLTECCRKIVEYAKELLERENQRLLVVSTAKLKDHSERILISET
ncbi:hypothetical protein HYU07_04235 [Candidatus Woesearchaeota archaeon]|nr:hypothetical protein [Candidatus Woesearchaeota archaeon]